MDVDKVRNEARELITKFGSDLEKVDINIKPSKNKGLLRKEGNGESCDIDFRTIMFKNAKYKNEVSLLLEKSSWS